MLTLCLTFWGIELFVLLLISKNSSYTASVQLLSRVQLFATPWTAACQTSLSFTISQSLLKLMSIECQWCHPTISSFVVPFSSCLQSFPASDVFPVSWLFTSGGQARRNINNLWYADDTTVMVESKELKSLLMKVKEESENVGLKLIIEKTKIMASGPIFMANSWRNNGNRERLFGGELQNHCRWWL